MEDADLQAMAKVWAHPEDVPIFYQVRLWPQETHCPIFNALYLPPRTQQVTHMQTCRLASHLQFKKKLAALGVLQDQDTLPVFDDRQAYHTGRSIHSPSLRRLSTPPVSNFHSRAGFDPARGRTPTPKLGRWVLPQHFAPLLNRIT